jgi:glutamate synthase (NADPH) large chain
MKQVFITGDYEQDDLERKLFVIRKLAENQIRNSDISQKNYFYLPSLSTKVMIYKGMFTPAQLGEYFPDLGNKEFKSAIALVHSRFSTNTFPTWDLAQPFRYLAHNGEINTIKGNRLWMQTRESLLKTDLFGSDLQKLFPVIEPGKVILHHSTMCLNFLCLQVAHFHMHFQCWFPNHLMTKTRFPEA